MGHAPGQKLNKLSRSVCISEKPAPVKKLMSVSAKFMNLQNLNLLLIGISVETKETWYHVFHHIECAISSTVTDSTYSPGAYSAGVETLATCQDVCMENQNCVALDYNYKDGNCWVHEKITDLNINYKWTDGNQYLITNKCATPPTRE